MFTSDYSIEKIVSAIEAANGEWLATTAARLAEIRLAGDHRRFLVNRMGSTGSTWFAKLLNSHPDVFCTHERVVSRAFPARCYGEEDILNLIRMLATDQMHGAYRAVGDVGSIWLGHAVNLPAFKTAVLLRHPARILNTRLSVTDASFTEIPEASKRCIREVWDIEPEEYPPADQLFLHDLSTFASHVWALGRVQMIRLEDLRDLEYCGSVLWELTGVEYRMAAVSRMLRERVNRRTAQRAIPDILRTFTRQQQEWYQLMLAEAALHLGYDLERDRN